MKPRDLSAHVPYEAGRGIEEVARELGFDPGELIKLASNENPLGPSPKAIESIRAAASRVHSYPKASSADLRDALAERWDVEPAQVWLSNGGDGAIDCLCRAMLDPGQDVLVPEPGFAYYGMSARFHHGEVTTYHLDESDGFEYGADRVLADYDGERIVFLTTPHNPTGSEITPAGIQLVAEETAEETLVVVDEAYGEFTEVDSAVSLLGERDDVAVIRTFSKVYGLAGLRLGYAVVPEAWADAYARVNTPFSAGELSCRAGLAALQDHDHVEQTKHVTSWSRNFMQDAINAPTYNSGGNFVLADVGAALKSDAPGIEPNAPGFADSPAADGEESAAPAAAVAAAMQRKGVIIRDCSSFGLANCVRITCGTENETRRAVESLNTVLSELGEEE